MNLLKSEMQNQIATPVVEEANSSSALGIVKKIDSQKNTCTVSFVNGYAGVQEKEYVPVRNDRNDEWFPKIGEAVRLMITDAGPAIVGSALTEETLKTLRSFNYEFIQSASLTKSYGRYIC